MKRADSSADPNVLTQMQRYGMKHYDSTAIPVVQVSQRGGAAAGGDAEAGHGRSDAQVKVLSALLV